MKRNTDSEMYRRVHEEMSQHRRRQVVVYAGIAENIGLSLEEELDERLRSQRDIIHEIERDGCVRGSLGSDPS